MFQARINQAGEGFAGFWTPQKRPRSGFRPEDAVAKPGIGR